MIAGPMLAAAVAGPLRFPLLATPKLDGVRCLVRDRAAVTKSGRPIPNHHIRSWIETHCPDGFDGELIVPGAGFHATAQAVATAAGTPAFEYHLFDFVIDDPDEPYALRMEELDRLECLVSPNHTRKLLPIEIRDQAALDAFEARCLAAGFEGVILRDAAAPYVAGATTARSQWMLKLKRFLDDEAVIVGAEPGRGECLRALRVLWRGIEFAIGTGFSHVQRAELWAARQSLAGQLVKFSYQPRPGQAAPSSATFLGLRPAFDL